MHFLKSAHLRALLAQTRWPGNFDWFSDGVVITINKEHRQQDRRVNIRKISSHEKLERTMDSIKVMALVAQFAPVPISERYLDLGEEDLTQSFSKILWQGSRNSGGRLCRKESECPAQKVGHFVAVAPLNSP